MISVNENVPAHTNRRLSETLSSKTALFSSTNFGEVYICLLYTSDAADEEDSVDFGGRPIIKKKKRRKMTPGTL